MPHRSQPEPFLHPAISTNPSDPAGRRGDVTTVAWRPSPAAPRVHLKELGASEGWSVELVRFDAGGAMTIAAAAGPYLLYVLDGELIHRGCRLWPGAACHEARDAEPGTSSSDIGCTILVVASVPGVGKS